MFLTAWEVSLSRATDTPLRESRAVAAFHGGPRLAIWPHAGFGRRKGQAAEDSKMRRRIWKTRVATTMLVVAGGVGYADAQDNGAAQFRLGAVFPSGGGEFFDENEQVFTFEPSDLNGWAFGFTYVMPISQHFELGWNLDYAEGSDVTQYRDVVDEDGFSILHDTWLRSAPASVDLRFLPAGRAAQRGSSGQYSARRPVPYIGAGVGANFWSYEEVGDFVDFGTDQIFTSGFEDDGVAAEAHVVAGLELPIGAVWSLTLEGRYAWSDDELSDDFAGLGKIVLDRGSVFLGWTYRF